MFDNLFPVYWSTLKRLIWLKFLESREYVDPDSDVVGIGRVGYMTLNS